MKQNLKQLEAIINAKFKTPEKPRVDRRVAIAPVDIDEKRKRELEAFYGR